MKVVHIALTQSDLDAIKTNSNQKCIVITDLEVADPDVRVVFKDIPDESELVREFFCWYKEQVKSNELSIGYVNNLYECSLRPIIRFISSIEFLISSEDEEFLFLLGKKPFLLCKLSAYFLAEYESMGVKLYDRRTTFLPYIIEYLQKRKASYKLTGITFPHQLYYKHLRRSFVFLYRLARAIACSVNYKSRDMGNVGVVDEIIVLRTVAQARSVLGYLKQSTDHTLVIVPTASFNTNTITFLTESLDNPSVSIVSCRPMAVTRILMGYLKNLRVRLSVTEFIYRGVELNLRDALKEISIMQLGLQDYENQIVTALKSFTIDSAVSFFSTEMSSPHAYIDAVIAEKLKLKSIQIQTGDKERRPLPLAVPSKLFLTKSKLEQRNLSVAWNEVNNKVRYFGSFGIRLKRTLKDGPQRDQCISLCFFTGAHADVNIELFDRLRLLPDIENYRIFIKRHPRDRVDYRRYEFVQGCLEEDGSLYQKYQSFSLAITYPSSVIGELISMSFPFSIYIPNHDDYKSYPGLEEELAVFDRCYSFEELHKTLLEVEERVVHSNRAIDNYHDKHQYFYDRSLVKANIEGFFN